MSIARRWMPVPTGLRQKDGWCDLSFADFGAVVDLALWSKLSSPNPGSLLDEQFRPLSLKLVARYLRLAEKEASAILTRAIKAGVMEHSEEQGWHVVDFDLLFVTEGQQAEQKDSHARRNREYRERVKVANEAERARRRKLEAENERLERQLREAQGDAVRGAEQELADFQAHRDRRQGAE